MSDKIVIVREAAGYRVLFGHLQLAGMLSMANEALIDVKGEGRLKIIKAAGGLFVKLKNRKLPVLNT
jgi:hypothetical protein